MEVFERGCRHDADDKPVGFILFYDWLYVRLDFYISSNIPAHTVSKEMSSPSPQFSFGAVSKRVTLPRYLLITCSANRKTHAFSLPACYRPSASLLRTFGVPRHFVPQSRSTSTNFANLLQCRRVRRPHWRPYRCPQAYMAHRRHLHPGCAHHGCFYCFLEERPTKYIERERRSGVDKCGDVRWSRIHEC